jgi:hypothetical protein
MHSFDLDEAIARSEDQLSRLRQEKFQIELQKQRQKPFQSPKDTWSEVESAQNEVIRTAHGLVFSARSYIPGSSMAEVQVDKLNDLVKAVEYWNTKRIPG